MSKQKEILNFLTVKELKEYAQSNNLYIPSKLTKSEIIQEIIREIGIEGLKDSRLEKIENFVLNTGWKNWDKVLSKFINSPFGSYATKSINILELGVFEGGASQWFLNNIIKPMKKKYRDKSYLYTVDTFLGSPEYTENSNKEFINSYDGDRVKNKFLEAIRLTGLEDNVKILQMMTYDALIILNSKNIRFDIIYVDASHEGRDVIADAVMSWKLLNPGGIMIFDDYIWDKLKPSYFTPKPAIDSFLYLYKPELKILRKERQVIVEKLECKDFENPKPHPKGYKRC